MRSGSARKRASDADDHCQATQAARRRISRACDRCRAQKARCDGGKPCLRCGDNIPCVYQEKKPLRRKYPAGYVDMLEEHQAYLITGLRKLYSCIQHDAQLPDVDRDGNNRPIVHELLDKLGIFEDPIREHSSSMTGSEADEQSLGSLHTGDGMGGATSLPESCRPLSSAQEAKPLLASSSDPVLNVTLPHALTLPNHIPLNTTTAEQRCSLSCLDQAGPAALNRQQRPIDLSNGFWRWSFDFSDFLAVSSRDTLR